MLITWSFRKPVTGKLNNKPSIILLTGRIGAERHTFLPYLFTDEGSGWRIYWSTRFGFRSDPYKSKHAASFSYFFDKVGFIGRYSGEWLHAFGDYDFGVDAFVTGPTFTQYFYGLGNEYVDYGWSYHCKGNRSFSHLLSAVGLGWKFRYVLSGDITLTWRGWRRYSFADTR
jgi:hypothetical protein